MVRLQMPNSLLLLGR